MKNGIASRVAGIVGILLVQTALRLCVPPAAAQCSDGWIVNGLPGTNANGAVYCMIMWDPDGPGPTAPLLVVGGKFSTFGGVAVNNIATYDLETGAISNLGNGLMDWYRSWFTPFAVVDALAIDADGKLIAGGNFIHAGTPAGLVANGLARWDGAQWSAFGPSPGEPVWTIAPLPDGRIAVGMPVFPSVDPSALRFWDGVSWSNDGGLVRSQVNSLLLLPDGELLAGSMQYINSAHVNPLMAWDGANWRQLGNGLDDYSEVYVFALARLPNGDIVAGGSFYAVHQLPTGTLAGWNGSNWYAFGQGFGGWTYSITVLPDGRFVAGRENSGGRPQECVNLWTGQTWAPLGTGVNDAVYSTLLLPNGDLAVGGEFTTAGGVPAQHLARFQFGHRRADMNCDGVLNNFDIDGFVLGLTDASAYEAAYPTCNRANADVNCDSILNDFDIDPFVMCIVRNACP